jgi:hypothetical protein
MSLCVFIAPLMPVLECLNEEVVVKLMVCVPSKLILQLRLPQSHGGLEITKMRFILSKEES